MAFTEEELRAAFESSGGSYSDEELRSSFESSGGQYSEEELRSQWEASQQAPQDEPPGWLSTIGTSAAKGIGNVADGIAGLIKYGEDSFGLETGIGDSLIASQREYQKPREEILAKIPNDSAQQYVGMGVEGVTQYLPSLLSGAGPLGMAVQQGFTTFGKRYGDSLERGATPDQAENAAAFDGAVNTVLSAPVLQAAQAAGPLVQRVLASGGVGAITGLLGGVVQPFIDSTETGKPVQPYDALEPSKKGFILGGLTGGLTPIASRAIGGIDNALKPKIDEAGIETQLRAAMEQPAVQPVPEQPSSALVVDPAAPLPPVTDGAVPVEPIIKGPDYPQKLEAFARLVQDHDLSYQMSDSSSVFDRGTKSEAAIRSALREIDPVDAQRIWDQKLANVPEDTRSLFPLPSADPRATELPAPPPPEPKTVVKTTEVVEAPKASSKEFPDPIKPEEVKVKAEVVEPLQPPEQPVAPRNNWEALRQKAAELGGDIEQLSPDQSFFQGDVFGREIPGASQALSFFRNTLTPRVISQKFPELAGGLYKAGRRRIESEHASAFDLMESLRPYLNADNPELVDTIIGKRREATLGARRKAWEAKQDFKPTPIDDAALRQMGASDADIAAIRAYDASMDMGLDKLSTALKQKARRIQSEDKRAQYEREVDAWIDSMRGMNYFPARRYGNSFEVIAKNKDGLTTFRDHFDSALEAKRAAAELTKSGKYKGDKISVGRIPEADMDAYADLPGNLGAEASNFDPSKWEKLAEQGPMFGFQRHLVPASGVAGYEKNIRKSTLDYVLGLSKFAAKAEADATLDGIISNLPEGSALRGYAQRYKEQLNTPQGKITKGLLKLQNLKNLALVPSSALINTTQTITTTEPKAFGELTKLYGVRAPIELGIVNQRAVAQSFAYLADRLGGKVSGWIRKTAGKLDPELFEHLNLGTKEGIIDAEGMGELYNQKRILEGNPSIADTMMFMFSAAEKANRLYAFNIGREVGKAKGLSGPQLYDYAKDFVNTTQFDQTVANRPPLLANGPMRVVAQYRTFQLGYLGFLKDHLKPKDWGTLGVSLGALLAVGGYKALPFARETERAAEYSGINIKDSIKKFIGDEKWAERVTYGLPFEYGVGLSGSLSTEVLPEFETDPKKALVKALGPTADTLYNGLPKAYELFTQKDNPSQAVETIFRGARGPLRALRAAYTGQLEDPDGRPKLQDVTPQEVATLAMGAQPSRLQREQEFQSEKFKAQAKSRYKPGDYNTLLAQAVSAQDTQRFAELMAEIAAYNEGKPAEQRIQPNLKQIMKEVKGMKNPTLGEFLRAQKDERPMLIELMRKHGKLPTPVE